MSQTIASVVVILLSSLLPYFGIELPSEQLTEAVQTIVIIGAGIWIWARRVQSDDVNIVGKRK